MAESSQFSTETVSRLNTPGKHANTRSGYRNNQAIASACKDSNVLSLIYIYLFVIYEFNTDIQDPQCVQKNDLLNISKYTCKANGQRAGNQVTLFACRCSATPTNSPDMEEVGVAELSVRLNPYSLDYMQVAHDSSFCLSFPH